MSLAEVPRLVQVEKYETLSLSRLGIRAPLVDSLPPFERGKVIDLGREILSGLCLRLEDLHSLKLELLDRAEVKHLQHKTRLGELKDEYIAGLAYYLIFSKDSRVVGKNQGDRAYRLAKRLYRERNRENAQLQDLELPRLLVRLDCKVERERKLMRRATNRKSHTRRTLHDLETWMDYLGSQIIIDDHHDELKTQAELIENALEQYGQYRYYPDIYKDDVQKECKAKLEETRKSLLEVEDCIPKAILKGELPSPYDARYRDLISDLVDYVDNIREVREKPKRELEKLRARYFVVLEEIKRLERNGAKKNVALALTTLFSLATTVFRRELLETTSVNFSSGNNPVPQELKVERPSLLTRSSSEVDLLNALLTLDASSQQETTTSIPVPTQAILPVVVQTAKAPTLVPTNTLEPTLTHTRIPSLPSTITPFPTETATKTSTPTSTAVPEPTLNSTPQSREVAKEIIASSVDSAITQDLDPTWRFYNQGRVPKSCPQFRSLIAQFFTHNARGLIEALMAAESNCDPRALNPRSGAAGLLQVYPVVWWNRVVQKLGSWEAIFNPASNIRFVAEEVWPRQGPKAFQPCYPGQEILDCRIR